MPSRLTRTAALRYAAVLAAGLLSAAAEADDWAAVRVSVGRVDALAQHGDRAFVRAGGRWLAAHACATGICLARGSPPARRRAPGIGLPDAAVATASGGDIVAAWYEGPSDHYTHGVLGDAIEPTTLSVRDAAGREFRTIAPDGGVFEDLTPRIADLDRDGSNEVVTIASAAGRGAALAVYGLDAGRLTTMAATPPVGRSHRWRNPSVIADLNGDGRPEIAEVVTPHIGGTLNIWSYRERSLRLTASRRGYSNHVIGSRELNLAAAADADGDGRTDLALPSADRRALAIVTLKGGRLTELTRVPLPAPIDKAVAAAAGPEGPVFLAGTADGSLFAIARRAGN